MPTTTRSALGLDVGGKRVGIAIASLSARLPRPLSTLERDEGFFEELTNLAKREGVKVLVVGLPRGLEGQRTAQTAEIETFIQDLRKRFDLPVYTQDEAVTSKNAEAELQARGKPYVRGDIDALAATYILQDWLAGQETGKGMEQ